MRYLILILFIQTVPLAAQPVIDSDHAPAIGDAFTMHQGMYLNIPLTGADQVWDYSSINAAGILQYQILPIDPADTADFPAAQMMLEIPGAEFFYSIATNGLFDHGTNDQLGQVQFSDPKQVLAYPLAYGSTWNDQFTGVAGEATISGTNDCVVNGHGTLLLPWGPVPGVLRTRCVTTTTLEGVSTMLTRDTIVMFHHPGFPWHLLRSRRRSTYIDGQQHPHQWSLEFASEQSVTAVAESENVPFGIEVFPVPADRAITIRSENATHRITSVEIIDLHGKICSSQVATDARTVIDLDRLENGLYLIRARFANGAARTLKFIVQL